jgi:hypothetical protein
VTNEEPRHQPDEGESTDIQFFTRSELVALSSDKVLDNVREIALYIFDNCLDKLASVPTSDFK